MAQLPFMSSSSEESGDLCGQTSNQISETIRDRVSLLLRAQAKAESSNKLGIVRERHGGFCDEEGTATGERMSQILR